MKKYLIALALVSTPVLAKPVGGNASFKAVAKPLVGEFEGKGGVVSGDLDDHGLGTLTVQLKDLKTGMDGRDAHMNEYLETDKYPEARLVVKKFADGKFDGDFSLHGVTKPVSGTATRDGWHAEADFTVDLSQFGLGELKRLGITVQTKEIKVHAAVFAK